MGAVDPSNLLPIQKHDQGRRPSDLVALRKTLLDRDVYPEKRLCGPQRRGHLLENRLERSAVRAAVGHELDGDWSVAFQDQSLECPIGDRPYGVLSTREGRAGLRLSAHGRSYLSSHDWSELRAGAQRSMRRTSLCSRAVKETARSSLRPTPSPLVRTTSPRVATPPMRCSQALRPRESSWTTCCPGSST